jgi:hypothetical protein
MGRIRQRETSNFAGRSESEAGSPEIKAPSGNGFEGILGVSTKRRTHLLWVKAAAVDEELGRCSRRGPGTLEGDMQRRNSQRKPGTTRWSPRRRAVGRTARASRINRAAAKSRCAGEWGGWGRISDDGPGHYNPDRSEGPWGKAAKCRLHGGAPAHCGGRTQNRVHRGSEGHEGRMQTARREELADDGKASPDRPALKPYWGKPAVRNFREGDGNDGIIRSPGRAIVLPGEQTD